MTDRRRRQRRRDGRASDDGRAIVLRGDRRDDTLRGDQRGVAYVEFLLAFLPIFTLFLGIAQLVLLWSARIVVEHAATRAARAAVVVLDDDPRYYDGEARDAVGGAALEAGDLLVAMGRLGIGARTGETSVDASPAVLSRRASIELAAALTVAPLVARSDAQSVRDALGSDALSEVANRVIADLDVSIDGVVTHASLDPDDVAEPVTVQVSYRFACGVPVARMLVCPDGTKLITARSTLPNHRAALSYAPGEWAP